ncbi:MAG: hypothetical protein JNK67_08435 [Alphaproteobacteria bacterium]|nr:hypothetical protein [Alphaproteobacteria bacterium]
MPLDHGPAATPNLSPSGIELAPLGRQATLVAWTGAADGDARRGFRAALDARPVPPPAAHCSIAHGDRQIHLLALPVAASSLAAAPLDVSGLDGATLAHSTPARGGTSRAGDLDVVGLIGELRASERVRLCRFVLEVCPPLFKLARDAQFVALADDIVQSLSRRPGRLQAHSLAGPLAVYDGVVRRGLGRHLTAVVVSRHGVLRSPIPPGELPAAAASDEVARLAIALDRDIATAGGILVILGESGIACRLLPNDLPACSTYERARSDKGIDGALRDYLIDALVAADKPESSTRAALAELRAATSSLAGAAAAPSGPAGGRLDCLVSNAGGIAAIGVLDDPHDLLDGLIVTRRNRPTVVELGDLMRFPAASDARPRPATGFVLALPPMSDANLPASVELRARLRSGETVRLGSGPTSPAAAGESLALLHAAAARTTRIDELAERLGPVVRAGIVEAAVAADIAIEDIGGAIALPRTSLITPAGGDPGMLRARFAAFALDGTLGETELIVVVDGPEAGDAVRGVLAGLVGLHGRPARLAVPNAGVPMAQALTQATLAARAPFIALLDEAAIPRENGWLDALAGALAARPRAGLVAAQMLHPDGSLVDAGLEWADADVPARGPAPRLAGFPAAFPGHEAAQRADAVRRGAWFMRRSLFELVGGLDATMLSKLGTDIAFATRLGIAGFETWTLGEPRFVCFAPPPPDRVQQLREAIDIAPLAAARIATAAATAQAPSTGAAPIPMPAAAADAELSGDVEAPKPRKRHRRKSKRAA